VQNGRVYVYQTGNGTTPEDNTKFLIDMISCGSLDILLD
jgi:hypothetical protein